MSMFETPPYQRGSRASGEPSGPLGYRMSRGRFLIFAGIAAATGWLGLRFVESLLGGFRINTVERPTPAFDPASYTLTIDGLVDKPAVLNWDQVMALPRATQVSDFHCVEGWGVEDVAWEGFRLQAVKDLVAPKPEATFVNFYSMGDTYLDSLALEQASLPDLILAYRMFGSPLEQNHGSPLRVIMPRMYGYKGAKWLKRIEFTDRRETGYWEVRGWQLDPWISSPGSSYI